MNGSIRGGLVLAVFFATNAVAAQLPRPQAPTTKPRGSFFTASQNRSDIPAHIERTFKALDIDQDGFVTRDEIKTVQAQFEARAAKSAPKRAARLFDRLDSDHDGKITLAEITASHKPRPNAGDPAAKPTRGPGRSSLFARADANKDGVITRAEFDAAVSAGKLTLRHAGMRGGQIVRLFDVADVNKDGRLSLDEAQQAALAKFDAADADHDGVLTPAERRRASKAEHAKRRATI
jgi:Ca2+-binding EF-hand superfamily protein